LFCFSVSFALFLSLVNNATVKRWDDEGGNRSIGEVGDLHEGFLLESRQLGSFGGGCTRISAGRVRASPFWKVEGARSWMHDGLCVQ